jgi:hypothetical protein
LSRKNGFELEITNYFLKNSPGVGSKKQDNKFCGSIRAIHEMPL